MWHAGGVDISPSTANFNGGERTAAELPTQPAAASPAAPPLAGAAVPPQPESTAGNGLAQRSNRSAGGRGRGRGSGPRRQASSRKQGAGRKSGTSVLDAALARPSEGSSDQPGSEGVANAQNGDGVETEAIPERAAQNPESVHEETEERAQARHVADARWNAAIKKDGSLRPKSKKDYIRGLKTYKVTFVHQLDFGSNSSLSFLYLLYTSLFYCRTKRKKSASSLCNFGNDVSTECMVGL